MKQLALPLAPRKPARLATERRRLPAARKAAARRKRNVFEYQYESDAKGRRVLVGLTHEETTEFELLEAQLPMYQAELRWLELFNKHERAREQAIA
jgi:hypothetical protein